MAVVGRVRCTVCSSGRWSEVYCVAVVGGVRCTVWQW